MLRRALGFVLTLAVFSAPAWAGNIKADGQLISLEPTEPPLVVSSTARVDNLNAELLDGQPASAFVTGAVVRRQVFTDDTAVALFVVPAGVDSLQVTVIGGGGGGGGGDIVAGGGGGGSGLVVGTMVSVGSGESLSVDVGAGGGAEFFVGDDGEPSILSSNAGWRVEAAGGKGGGSADPVIGGNGGSGLFGGGGGAGDSSGGSGGDGIFGDGENGSFEGGAGASGGQGGIFGGGGGGGAGGGDGGADFLDGAPGTQPGAGGGGGGDSAPGGDGAAGAIVIEWVGPPLGS